jgi:hypothetical protein
MTVSAEMSYPPENNIPAPPFSRTKNSKSHLITLLNAGKQFAIQPSGYRVYKKGSVICTGLQVGRGMDQTMQHARAAHGQAWQRRR